MIKNNKIKFKDLKDEGSTLSVHTGDSLAIQEMQKELNKWGYTDGHGNELIEDGDFGKNTFNAVIKYQEDNGLVSDGVVGDKTWKSMSDKKRTEERNNSRSNTESSTASPEGRTETEMEREVYKTIDKALNSSSVPHGEDEEVSADDFESAKDIGSKLSIHSGFPYAIQEMQKSLNKWGYTDGHGNELIEDGDFDKNTFNAVIKYQEDNGLVPDGVVGDKTWKSMSDKKRAEKTEEIFNQKASQKKSYDGANDRSDISSRNTNNYEFYNTKYSLTEKSNSHTKDSPDTYETKNDTFLPVKDFSSPESITLLSDKDNTNDSEKNDKISDFDIDAAKIAQHIYDNDDNSTKKAKQIDGWELLYCFTGREGLKAGVYIKIGDNAEDPSEYVVAYQGSKEWIDWKNNFEQVSGPDSIDMQEAIAYAKVVKKFAGDKKVTFVGHSKGGAEAIAAATATNCDAVVFNPALANFDDYGVSSENYTGNIKAYIVENEILHDVQGDVNENVDVILLPDQNEWAQSLKNIPPTAGAVDIVTILAILYGGYKNHKIDSVISAFEEKK